MNNTKIHARVIIKILLDFWFSGREFFTIGDMNSLMAQLIKQTKGVGDEIQS